MIRLAHRALDLDPRSISAAFVAANGHLNNKITIIFGRKITKHYRGKLQTEIEDMNLPNPVIRSHQYERRSGA